MATTPTENIAPENVFTKRSSAEFGERGYKKISGFCQVIYSQFGSAFHQNDHQARRRFVEWAQNEIAVVPDFHKRILYSDEAHFWLNGYVNKQNCRIWSEANPQVYVETPLHALGRQVAGRNYPPTNKNTLIRALTEEWDKLPQQLLDNVVQSMVRRVECCITLHGGHIPY
ncbi:hypothetical protein TNCV_3588031 [Trichonephila clavipes]|nr:hypothetical protein TNCV_3588031 [Trichonephila clavipes]